MSVKVKEEDERGIHDVACSYYPLQSHATPSFRPFFDERLYNHCFLELLRFVIAKHCFYGTLNSFSPGVGCRLRVTTPQSPTVVLLFNVENRHGMSVKSIELFVKHQDESQCFLLDFDIGLNWPTFQVAFRYKPHRWVHPIHDSEEEY